MMHTSTPTLKDLVLVGGGHSHVTVLKSFGMEPMPGVRLTLISRDAHAPYSGMLPGLIAGNYDFDETHIDLMPLARFAGARFFHDEAVGVDPAAKVVFCRERPPVAYDVLSINIGSTPGLDVAGARDAVVPVKPIDGFNARWHRLRDGCLARRSRTDIGVVGGGAGGVELLLAVQYRLRALLAQERRPVDHLVFHLATMTDEILPTHNTRVREKFRRVLRERGVHVITGREVIAVEPVPANGEDAAADSSSIETDRSRSGERRRLRFKGGEALELDEIIWVTTAGAAAWPRDSGLDVDERGFIVVDESLRSTSDPDIFAAGDIAAVAGHPRPKAGVFAVRQGPPLAENLRLRLLGEEARPFHPQTAFLSLISTGDRYAVASRGEWAAEGRWVWTWKDRIDRRFMEKFNVLPEMDAGEAPEAQVDPRLLDPEAAEALARADPARLDRGHPGSPVDPYDALDAIASLPMRCGGCGAKVGSTVLERVLSRLRPIAREDVVVGLDAPDDAAITDVPAGKQLVQTVDFFRAFVDDPFVFGKIAANHSLGDIFAMGAEPQTALAMVTIPFGLEKKVEADLDQLLAGALAVLNAENTALAGGHTSEGAELALGFSINGLVDSGAAIGKGGMRPGQRLILTKPLGTGALFAAHMRLAAKSRWVVAALRSMQRSNRRAAQCLIEHGVSAMSDVTGFGLVGHLMEMANASRVDATVDLTVIPALEGAREVIERGMFSSLQVENIRLRRAVANVHEASSHGMYPLVFDPQTAGGLLASLPAENARACINALHGLGYGDAVIVGSVHEANAAEAPIRLLTGS